MRIWKIILAFGLLALIVSCASGRWETTTPEKRYQAMVNSDPNRAAKNRRAGEWTNTFSVLAPEGEWLFMSSTPFGHIYFNGGPEGVAGRYVGYESRFLIRPMNSEDDALELEAFKAGDYDTYIEKAIKRTIGKHEKKQESYSDGRGGKHPWVPGEFSISMIRVQEMNCRLYQSSNHQYVWSQELGTEGPGAEEYSVGISCPGFFKGDFVSFSCGNTIRISNMHKMHGVDIDHEAIVQDLKKRIQRSLDSVQFDGDFTLVVPEKYR
ncbi:MAG: hypothetical protein CL539_10235 [Alcanivorax sp.]|jgi:hypothetical protein|uniref:hypothetical protein n=1 Tax=Alcanivorax TaxID=59753 RepID=UPI000C6607C0|nr:MULTISPECIES: hypothetical protein [Alcanivorax]MAC15021.1 hypothetical protein [Alcanivorax sp.]MBG33223.1 hypothetical protein [Alcanivorax sp.]MDF1636470.1 hypothetical protein [Alcanivorax jadensis]|tara:strand:- start:3974 stop:4771 length:798 start_codon:yes stop_codon:yes gene_type:complete